MSEKSSEGGEKSQVWGLSTWPPAPWLQLAPSYPHMVQFLDTVPEEGLVATRPPTPFSPEKQHGGQPGAASQSHGQMMFPSHERKGPAY